MRTTASRPTPKRKKTIKEQREEKRLKKPKASNKGKSHGPINKVVGPVDNRN